MKREYLIPDWPAPASVKAYASTRRCSGQSPAPFDQFNLSNTVGDDPQAVISNRQRLQHDLELPQEPAWLKQVHGHQAIAIDAISPAPIEADASYSKTANRVCTVMTADCASILLCHTAGHEVAAIHAGWRGLLAGVIENTISAMESSSNDILAWIGPAIGPKHFEVNQSIYESYQKKHPVLSQAFRQPEPTRWFADLHLLVKLTLQLSGIQAIYGDPRCTYQEENLFYSYRRDHGKTGRMASLIWIENIEK